MFSAIDKIFADKKCIGILGMGREGLSSYSILRRYYPNKRLFLIDEKGDFVKWILGLSREPHTKILTGNRIYKLIETRHSIDFILKTPGISLKDCPQLKNDPRISSQTEVFLSLFGKQCIGITGTKGKSTTTHLIYHILKTAGKRVLLAGNMGIPLFDIISEITPETIIVCELSSHQLEYVKHPPRIGILLNLFEEHLDHYVDFLAYQKAKMNIFAGAADGNSDANVAIFNADDPLIMQRLGEMKFQSVRLPFSKDVSVSDRAITDGRQSIQILLDTPCTLIGEHNNYNKQAAILAARVTGVSDLRIEEGLRTFETLPHRLQYIGKVNGIDFYDDSISTVPQATIAAIESIRNVKKVGSIILGGLDRGIDYSALVEYLKKNPVNHIAFTGEAGRRIQFLLKKRNALPKQMIVTDNYIDIVRWCKHQTGKGKACILSPAAASYDKFKNFEERGKVFTALVLGRG